MCARMRNWREPTNMAAAGEDKMYLENLEEFVNDEDKIVTYKWLSRTLSVSVNKAKQMLYEFAKLQQEKHPNSSLNVTYAVGGWLNMNGDLVQKYIVVADQDLEDTKEQFCPLTCVHVYSVQKCKLKDSNSLYAVDYSIIEEGKENQNRWSHIYCKEAKPSSNWGTNRGEIQHSAPTTNGRSTVDGASEKSNTTRGELNGAVDKKSKPTNEKTRKGQMSALEMFAKKPNSSSGKTEKRDSAAKVDEAKKKETGQPESMRSFFGKAVVKGSSTSKACEKEKTKIKHTKDNRREVEENEEDEEEPLPKNISKQIKKECDTEEKVKQNSKTSQKKEDVQRENSKRKTKKKRAFIQESDEGSEEEKPAGKSTSKITKSKRKRKRMKDVSEDEDSQECDRAADVADPGSPSSECIPDAQPQSEAGRRRKRRKVLRSKTYMNDDGYMVTEKVWESESTDASDEEGEERARRAGSTSSKATATPADPAPAPRKPSRSPDAKKMNKPGKQASIMGFFKKP